MEIDPSDAPTQSFLLLSMAKDKTSLLTRPFRFVYFASIDPFVLLTVYNPPLDPQ